MEIKDYNVKIVIKNLFDDTETYENIRKIGTGQGDDYTTASFLDYTHFKENYK